MLFQVGEADHPQSCSVRGLQNDPRRGAGFQSFLPPRCTQAPLVARFKPRKPELRPRRAEIVAARPREVQKLPGHPGAHRVQPDIFGTGVAAAVTEESRKRLLRALGERLAQYVEFGFQSASAEVGRGGIPIHDLPDLLKVFRARIPVIDVVRVFPDVDRQYRRLAVAQRIRRIGGIDNLDAASYMFSTA